MKKNELNITAKAEVKKIQKLIESSLVTKLKAVTAKLGEGTDKLQKEIAKGSKKLAKKLIKEIKIGTVATTTPNEPKEAPATEPKAEKKAAPQKAAVGKAKPVKSIENPKAVEAKAAQPEKKKAAKA